MKNHDKIYGLRLLHRSQNTPRFTNLFGLFSPKQSCVRSALNIERSLTGLMQEDEYIESDSKSQTKEFYAI